MNMNIKKALHGMVTMYSNVISDIHIAKMAGYEGLEIHTEKLWRYINAGGTAADLKAHLDLHGIEASAIDIIGGVELTSKDAQNKLQYEAETLSIFAQEIGAKTIQLNAFTGLDGLDVKDNIYITAKSIKKLVKIGAKYAVRFQYEGAAWTPIHTLHDCLELMEQVGEDNFGLVIDFWHFWASRGASPDDIAKLDKQHIFGVHCCGGIRPTLDANGNISWVPETELRGYFPYDDGHDGADKDLLPVKDWADAIKATGYEGWVSGEFLNEGLWEGDNVDNAIRMKKGLDIFF